MKYQNVKQVDCSSSKMVTLQYENSKLIVDESSSSTVSYLRVPRFIDLNISTKNNSLGKKALKEVATLAYAEGLEAFVLCSSSDNPLNQASILESTKSYAKYTKEVETLLSIDALKDSKSLSNISIMIEQGAVAITIDSDMDSNLMRRVMQYAQMKKVPIFCTLQDSILNADAVMNEGTTCSKLGLVGNTILAEVIQVGKIIEMARFFEVDVLVRGISTAKVLHQIHQAKLEGVKVYSEVSIHHLVKSDESCKGYNTYAKITPPLRSSNEVAEMQSALSQGKIDILTSMHAPKTTEFKETAFTIAQDGIEGLESIFALYYTLLVETNLITLETLLELIVKNPAKLLGLDRGVLSEGSKSLLFAVEKNSIDNRTSLYNGQELSLKMHTCLDS